MRLGREQILGRRVLKAGSPPLLMAGMVAFFLAFAAPLSAVELSGAFLQADTIKITEIQGGGNTTGNEGDALEIQNVSGAAVNVDGWKVIVSGDTWGDWTPNPTEATLSGNLEVGETKAWSDNVGSSNYWGANIYWGVLATSTSYVLLVDDSGVVVDFVCVGWSPTDISSGSIACSAGTYFVSAMWNNESLDPVTAYETESWQRVGNSDTNSDADWKVQYYYLWKGDGHSGIAVAADSYQRTGASDTDSASDWTTQAATTGSANTPLTSGVFITEVDANDVYNTAGDLDFLEIQNTGSSGVDVTGWTLVISDHYDGFEANVIEQNLTGTLTSFSNWTDDSLVSSWTTGNVATYWGNNIYWADSSAPVSQKWILLLDDSGVPVDFFCSGWTAAQMANAYVYTQAWGAYPIISMGNTNHGLKIPWSGATASPVITVGEAEMAEGDSG
ncbi:MAG: hypothetical protein QF645_04980, partial [Planctomycetota bacterium]|nr:hypothetical protein [Planctomycetota bacterium]